MRLKDLFDRARLLGRLSPGKLPASDFKDMDECFIQLGSIADLRGELVHRVVTYIGTKLRVTNSLTARTLVGIESRLLDIADLKAMTIDCMTIFVRLSYIAEPKSFRLPDGEQNFLCALVLGSWRYKPASPNPQPRAPRTKQPGKKKPKRQPQA